MAQDQSHPQEKKDRGIVNRILQEQATDNNLLELARLRIRYHNFPGARDLQEDLDFILKQWQLTEAELFAKTRQIYASEHFSRRYRGEDQQDWS